MLGNGICNGGLYNTKDCDFDNGDCEEFNVNFPGCAALEPSKVKNGKCDNAIDGHNTELCKFDGGDCDNYNAFKNDKKNKKCTIEGDFDLLFNGRCDDSVFNIKDCGDENGECKEFNKLKGKCVTTKPWTVGDSVCDDENNTKDCKEDGGDCPKRQLRPVRN